MKHFSDRKVDTQPEFAETRRAGNITRSEDKADEQRIASDCGRFQRRFGFARESVLGPVCSVPCGRGRACAERWKDDGNATVD